MNSAPAAKILKPRRPQGSCLWKVSIQPPTRYAAALTVLTYAKFNKFCGALPATSYVVQWGGSHVWKVGDKVFAIGGWDEEQPAFTFKTNEIVFSMLSAMPGVRPAPYFASRGMSWIQHYAAPGLDDTLLKEHLRESHRIVSLGLTKKLQKELGLNRD